MEIGELGYRPPGNAFWIFFGKILVSTVDRPRTVSFLSLLGQIDGEATVLRQATASPIKIAKREEE